MSKILSYKGSTKFVRILRRSPELRTDKFAGTYCVILFVASLGAQLSLVTIFES